MEKYKPQYLGKIMPDEPPKLMNFMQQDYEKFSKVYDACKDTSGKIEDVKNVSTGDDLVVKIMADSETVKAIADKIDDKADPKLTIEGDKIKVSADDSAS